jgi:hypothetical protein
MEGDGGSAHVADGLRTQIFNLRTTFTTETKQAIYDYVGHSSPAITNSPGENCRHPHVDLRSLDVAQLRHIYDMIVSRG